MIIKSLISNFLDGDVPRSPIVVYVLQLIHPAENVV